MIERLILNMIICFRYNVMFTMVTYMTPMLGMGACYVQIGRNLWGGEVIGKFELHSLY